MTKTRAAKLQAGDIVETPRGPRTVERTEHEGQGYQIFWTDGGTTSTMAGRKWTLVG